MFGRQRKTDCEIVREHLSAYLDDQLEEIEFDRVKYHVDVCQQCRQELESLRATCELLHTIPTVPAPRSFTLAEASARHTWFPVGLPEMAGTAWLRTAAAAALIAFALLISLDFSGALDSQASKTQGDITEAAAATSESGDMGLPRTSTVGPGGTTDSGTGVPEATPPVPGSDTNTGIAGQVTPGEPEGSSGEADIPEQAEAVDPYGESGVSSPSPRSTTPAWVLPVEILTGALVLIFVGLNFLIWRRRQTSN